MAAFISRNAMARLLIFFLSSVTPGQRRIFLAPGDGAIRPSIDPECQSFESRFGQIYLPRKTTPWSIGGPILSRSEQRPRRFPPARTDLQTAVCRPHPPCRNRVCAHLPGLTHRPCAQKQGFQVRTHANPDRNRWLTNKKRPDKEFRSRMLGSFHQSPESAPEIAHDWKIVQLAGDAPHRP